MTWVPDLSSNQDVSLFTSVDHTSDPAFFVRFMDAVHRVPGMETAKTLMRQRLALHRGDSVLDVGCGPGISLLEMRDMVGLTGRLTGIDASATMIGVARQRAAALGVPASFEVGDAQKLPHPDGTFDVCHAERVLMHVPDPVKVMSEMVRVARPGSRIGVHEPDWDATIIDSADKETARTFAHTFSDAILHGRIGRQLPRLFKESGLTDVSVDIVPVFPTEEHAELVFGGHAARLQKEGVLSPAQVRAWWDELRAAANQDRFFLVFLSFIVVGVKPGAPPNI